MLMTVIGGLVVAHQLSFVHLKTTLKSKLGHSVLWVLEFILLLVA